MGSPDDLSITLWDLEPGRAAVLRGPDTRQRVPTRFLGRPSLNGMEAGTSSRRLLPLPAKSLAYWNEARHTFALESGQIELLADSSSADIRLRKMVNVNN